MSDMGTWPGSTSSVTCTCWTPIPFLWLPDVYFVSLSGAILDLKVSLRPPVTLLLNESFSLSNFLWLNAFVGELFPLIFSLKFLATLSWRRTCFSTTFTTYLETSVFLLLAVWSMTFFYMLIILSRIETCVYCLIRMDISIAILKLSLWWGIGLVWEVITPTPTSMGPDELF